MEDRYPHRRHHLRAVLLHPHDGAGSRRRLRGVRARWGCLQLAGSQDGTAQSTGTIDRIQLAAGALTGGFILISLLIMAFYPLTEKVFRDIVGEISARRAEREATSSVEPLAKA